MIKYLCTAGFAASIMSALLWSGAARADALADFNAKADAAFEAATKAQTEKVPTTGPAIVKDQVIVNVACAMAAEGCARPARAVQEAAEAIGWKSLLFDAAGDPTKAADAVRQAISMKADAIVLGAIDARVILQPLKEAKAAGIKVVGWTTIDVDGVFDTVVPSEPSLTEDGYTAAVAAYVLGGHKLKMIMMRADEFGSVVKRVNGTQQFIDECKAAGGDCEIVSQENFLVTDLTTRVPDQAVSQVRRNPQMTVLWGGYDAGLNFMIQGLQAAGLTGTGFAVGFDANVANLDIIRNDGYQKATVGLPAEWAGYSIVDQINRLLAGEKLAENQGVHSKLLVKDNLPPSGAWQGDADFRADYHKLWGLK